MTSPSSKINTTLGYIATGLCSALLASACTLFETKYESRPVRVHEMRVNEITGKQRYLDVYLQDGSKYSFAETEKDVFKPTNK